MSREPGGYRSTAVLAARGPDKFRPDPTYGPGLSLTVSNGDTSRRDKFRKQACKSRS